MENMSYEAQTALVSLMAAMAVGGTVSIFGARPVVDFAKTALSFTMRRRMVVGLGLSTLTGIATYGASLLSSENTETAGLLAGSFS